MLSCCPAVISVGDLQPEMHTQRVLHHQGPLSSLSQSLLSDAGREPVQEHSDEDVSTEKQLLPSCDKTSK